MLVTRQCDTEHSHWPFSKFDPSPRKPSSPRMSNHFGNPLSAQSEWQEPCPYIPPGGHSIFQPLGHNNQGSGSSQTQPISEKQSKLSQVKEEPDSPANRAKTPATEVHLHTGHPSPLSEPSEARPDPAPKPTEHSRHEGLLSGISVRSPLSNTVDPASPGSHAPVHQAGHDERDLSAKEEEEEELDDEDMIDPDSENPLQPQTAAERTAARRKMKRFRLTHQQTRFLMSEFAKQPHPDAGHRERLSKEIPGLSPRQVQVWFQNRRAKIKRLNADDRDRMIKMRAVPDDFDNVQALHSPYGAVHGLGTPLASPMEFGNQSYAEHMIRPLMVDVRRAESDEVSPTGLNSGYGGVGFSASGGMGSSDLLSPLSQTSSDRYPYGSQLSTPLSASSRTSNPFARQNGLDVSAQLSQQNTRTLQPLHLRDSLARSRSDSLQSPLRSSMSWKGHTLDYSSYSGASTSPSIGERSASIFQPGQMAPTSTGGMAYDSTSYSRTSVPSPGVSFPTLQNSQNRSRLRASSATLPLNLDLRNQYRPVGSGNQPTSPPNATRTPSSSQYSSPSIYTTSYPSAPLTAPMEFSLPRTSSLRNSTQNYSTSQMSAPIAPSSDFSQALQGSLPAQSSRTPMRDSFSNGPLNYTQQRSARNESFGDDASGPDSLKRKRSFTLPSGTSASAN